MGAAHPALQPPVAGESRNLHGVFDPKSTAIVASITGATLAIVSHGFYCGSNSIFHKLRRPSGRTFVRRRSRHFGKEETVYCTTPLRE